MDTLRVTPEQVRRLMRQGKLVVPLDVRSPESWAAASSQAASAVRMPLTDFDAHAADLPRDAELIAYCT